MSTMQKRKCPVLLGLLALQLVALAVSGCGPGDDSTSPLPELRILAAASLADVVGDLVAAFELESERFAAEVSFAGSNSLARQIVAGVPADVFLSADEFWAQHVVAEGVADSTSLERFAGNRLVVITPAEQQLAHEGWPEALLEVERLALADPEGVPAGRYARAWLESRGLWEQLAERVVPTLDVRAALYSVASGSVDAGLVYATSVRTAGMSTDRVAVVYEVTGDAVPEIGYWSVLVAASGAGSDQRTARAFQRFLTSPTGRDILKRHGFEGGV